MILNKTDLTALIIGIRYEKSFKLLDMCGEIVDRVLHDANSPFKNNFFTEYVDTPLEKKLVNQDKGYELRILLTDIIFTYTLSDNIDDDIKWYIGKATKFIKINILEGFSIGNIERIGLMFKHTISTDNLGGRVLSKISKDIEHADKFMLSFARKSPTESGATYRGNDNYINNIVTVKQIESDKYDITLDHQYYYMPSSVSLKDWNESDFFKRSIKYLDNNFYELIEQLVGENVTIS